MLSGFLRNFLCFSRSFGRFLRNGLLCPQTIQMKFENTKRAKVFNEDDTPKANPRFRILKIQTFEDGLLARILKVNEVPKRLYNDTSLTRKQRIRVAIASTLLRRTHPLETQFSFAGHVENGQELFGRQLEKCADPRVSVLESAGFWVFLSGFLKNFLDFSRFFGSFLSGFLRIF